MGEDMSLEENEKFYHQHKVEVHLALMVFDPTDSSKTRFAIQHNQIDGEPDSLPYIKLPRTQPTLHAVKSLFKSRTGSDTDWLIVKQVGIVDFEFSRRDALVLLYSITMPETVPFLDSRTQWIDYQELSTHPHLRELIGLACNYNRMY